jgi:UDP-N-acetylglucosamine 2-epimerase (non-hydrolysing)
VTLHRRESWGPALEGICRALVRAVDDLPQLSLVYPVHPQPRVKAVADRFLRGHPRIHLVDPLD